MRILEKTESQYLFATNKLKLKIKVLLCSCVRLQDRRITAKDTQLTKPAERE